MAVGYSSFKKSFVSEGYVLWEGKTSKGIIMEDISQKRNSQDEEIEKELREKYLTQEFIPGKSIGSDKGLFYSASIITSELDKKNKNPQEYITHVNIEKIGPLKTIEERLDIEEFLLGKGFTQ